MGLEIRRGRESLATVRARKRLLARMHEYVLLQVRQLGETLGTRVALERSLARVHSQVHFQIRQLTERFRALLALVDYLAVLFAQRIRQRLVSAHLVAAATPAARVVVVARFVHRMTTVFVRDRRRRRIR